MSASGKGAGCDRLAGLTAREAASAAGTARGQLIGTYAVIAMSGRVLCGSQSRGGSRGDRGGKHYCSITMAGDGKAMSIEMQEQRKVLDDME